MKKIRSSQPAIPVLNCVKHQSFPVSIINMISMSRFIIRVIFNFLYRFNKLNVSSPKFSFSKRFQSLFSILSRKFVKTYLVSLLLKNYLLLMTLEWLFLLQNWCIFRKYFRQFVFRPVRVSSNKIRDIWLTFHVLNFDFVTLKLQ